MHKCYLKHVEPELVGIVKDSVCRRSMLCAAFQTKHCELTPLHACCDICEKKWTCDCDVCPQSNAAVTDSDDAESSEDEMIRDVSSKERLLLNQT